MRQSVEKIRARLAERSDAAVDLLNALLEPLSYQYRQKVLRSFEAEFKALPYALQEEAPNDTSSVDLLNIAVTVALMGFYRGVVIPLDGARKFSGKLERDFSIPEIQLGKSIYDKKSRTSTRDVVVGFQYMVVSMGIPIFVLQAGNSREAIKAYFNGVWATDGNSEAED